MAVEASQCLDGSETLSGCVCGMNSAFSQLRSASLTTKNIFLKNTLALICTFHWFTLHIYGSKSNESDNIKGPV